MSAPAPRPPRWLSSLLALWRLGQRRRDIEEDLAELFAERTATRGPGYARRRYLVDVLSVGWRRPRMKRETRRSRLVPTGIVQDVVFAARLFRRQPAIVAMTIAGLALAISVTTAVLTMVHRAVFPDTGIADPEAVFGIEGPPWPYPDYLQLRDSAQSVIAMAATRGGGGEFREQADADRGNLPHVSAVAVSGNYFDVLGARPAIGRLLTPADDEPDAPPAIVLSHRTWTTLLAADPQAIGRTVWLGSTGYTLVGVASRTFRHPHTDPPPTAWTSLAAQYTESRERRIADTRAAIAALTTRGGLSASDAGRLKTLEAALRNPQFPDQNQVFVRLRSGATRVQAESELQAFATSLLSRRGRTPATGTRPVQLRAVTELSSSRRRTLTLVAIPAALLVVLACANVANLLLATAVERRREIGTRLALGASRGRVARQLMTESLLLGAVGGAAGLVLASWLVPWLASLLTSVAPDDASPNPLVYVASALFTVAAVVAAGLPPARLAWGNDVASAVKTDRLGAPGGPGGGRLRTVLVGAQAAAAIVLLVISALFVRSFLHVSRYPHGAQLDRLVNVTIDFEQSDEARRAALLRAATERISGLNGVSGVSRVLFPPFSGGGATDRVAHGRPEAQPVHRNFVDASFFDTISARVVEGRTFTSEEVLREAPVAVITNTLAREFWPDGDAVGSSLRRLWGDDDAAGGSRTSWNRKPAGTRIVGVVKETTARVRTVGQATIYLPVSQEVEPLEQLVVRAASDLSPSSLVGPIHAALRALDPELSRRVEVTSERLRQDLWPLRGVAMVAGTVGMSGLVLAVIGLFAMTACAVAQRRHEVSVRVALGATGRQVVRMILRRSLTPVAVGLACGLGASGFADRLVRNWLIDIQPHDPLAIGSAVVVLLVSTVLAALLPARRASRVDPVQMLKQS